MTLPNKILLAVFACLLLGVAVSRLMYPIDLGLFESVVQTPAVLAIQGYNPYSFAYSEPFVMAPYGYLYYLSIGLGTVFGTNLWFGRLLSVLATVFIVYALFDISKRLKFDPLFAAIVFLSSAPFLSLWTVQRPDLVALAVGLGGFVLALRKQYFFAGLLCFGCLFFKPTFVLIPLFTGIYLLLKGRGAVVYGITGLLLSLLLITILGDTYIDQHFILTQNVPTSYLHAAGVLWSVLTPSTVFAFFLVARSHTLYYFGAAMLLAFVTSARAGSNINYYLESMFVLGMLIGKKGQTALTILLLLGCFQVARNARGEYFRWQDLSYYQEIQAKYLQHAGDVGISIYCDLIPNYHFGDWIQYIDGRSPELTQIFASAIKSGRYKAIIWHMPDDPHFTNYYMVPMESSLPGRPVYLYVLKQ